MSKTRKKNTGNLHWELSESKSPPQRASGWDKLAVSHFCNSWQMLRTRLHKRFLGMAQNEVL